jgi:hypothetical protein
MDKWLLNTKKIKLTVSTCDTNHTEETESRANEAGSSSTCSAVLMEQLPENDVDIFPNIAQKIKGVWLTINRGGGGELGCSTCKSVGKLGPMKTQGLKLANEWVEGSVKEYGDTQKRNSQSGKNFLAINTFSCTY